MPFVNNAFLPIMKACEKYPNTPKPMTNRNILNTVMFGDQVRARDAKNVRTLQKQAVGFLPKL